MNTDYGFFQLFRALNSLRVNESEPALREGRSAVEEELPHINYSPLRSPVHQQHYQQPRFRWGRFDLGLRSRVIALIEVADCFTDAGNHYKGEKNA